MKKLAFLISILATPALAQQQDPDFLVKALASLQTQRNAALDSQAATEARLGLANDKISKLEQELKTLKDKPKEDPKSE